MLNPSRIDSFIRVLICILIFWLPYSPAVVETCVILSLVLWIIKRCLVFKHNCGTASNPSQKFAIFIDSFKPVSTILNPAIAFFLFICMLAALGSPLLEKSVHGFFTKTLEWFVIFYLIVETFQTKRHIQIALGVFVLTMAATAFDALWQLYTGKDLFLGRVLEANHRVTAGFKTSISLGAFLIFPLFIVTTEIFTAQKYKKMGYLFVLLLVLWALTDTLTRGAWLAVIVGGVFFICIFAHRNIFLKRRMFWTVLLTVITVFLFLICKYNNHLFAKDRMLSLPWRISVWLDTVEMVSDRPYFGHGPNTFMSLFEYYRHRTGGDPTYAHNSYLQLAAETGLLGLGAFLLILVKLFQESLTVLRESFIIYRRETLIALGILSAILGFLSQSFFDNNLYSLQLSVLFWLMTAIMWASINLLKKEMT